MRLHMRSTLSLLAAMALLGLCILSLLFQASPALAAIRQFEEMPGQVVYQSRQAVVDQRGDRWQVIAFNRILSDGNASFYLRLVGFAGTVEIDRSRPLMLTNSLGEALTATDASGQIFTDASAPEPNVGQYDLQSAVVLLQAAIPVQLTLPILNKDDVLLPIAPALIQEWKTVAAYE